MARKHYTKAQRAQVVAAFVDEGKTLREAAAIVGCAASTALGWLTAAGVDVDAVVAQRDPSAKGSPGAAARLASLNRDKAEISEALRRPITLRSAHLLAARLERAEQDEALVIEARRRWHDAMVLEAQAEEFGPEAAKGARAAVAKAKVDVLIAEAGVPDAGELSLILSRSVRDLLAIEGELTPETDEGNLTVILTAPRPNRGPVEVVQLVEER